MLQRLYRFRTAYEGTESKIYLGAVDSRCAIHIGQRYVYQRIPKAANSSVLASLYHGETGYRASRQEDIREIRRSFSHPSSLTHEKLEEISHEFFRFTFVRNPIDRVISAYSDKIIRSEPQKLFPAAFFGRPLDDYLSFNEFIEYLDSGGLYDDPHWAPQTELMFFPVERLSYVGRIEAFDEGMSFVLREIFGRTNVPITWRPHKTSEVDGHSVKPTQSEIQALEKLYAQDLARLPY